MIGVFEFEDQIDSMQLGDGTKDQLWSRVADLGPQGYVVSLLGWQVDPEILHELDAVASGVGTVGFAGLRL